MRTTIDSYKARAGRLDLDGIDFDDFKDRPLPADALRSLRYMHDVEHHTVCYLRDLLLTPAHQDPEITSFLSCWVFEEMWHGEAIGRVLDAHGEEAGVPRIAALRHGRRRRQALTTLSTIASAAFAGRAFIALQMTWGAVNEWTTQAGYARLAESAGHPTLRELLRRIMKQEGSHIDFYASEATRRLGAGRAGAAPHTLDARPLVAARRLGRHATTRSWLPGAVPVRRAERQRHRRAHRPPDRPTPRAERPAPAHCAPWHRSPRPDDPARVSDIPAPPPPNCGRTTTPQREETA